MKREQIEELWHKHQPLLGEGDLDFERHILEFAKGILLEAAKMACIGCKKYGPALENRGIKFHTTQGASGYVHSEPCRAPQFYLEA